MIIILILIGIVIKTIQLSNKRLFMLTQKNMFFSLSFAAVWMIYEIPVVKQSSPYSTCPKTIWNAMNKMITPSKISVHSTCPRTKCQHLIKLNSSSTPSGFLQFTSLSNPTISSTQFCDTIPVEAQADGLWLFIQFNSRSADVRYHLHKILPLPLILSYLTAFKAMSALIGIGLQTPLLLTKFGFYERGILGLFDFS